MPGPADKPPDPAEPRRLADSAARVLFGAAIATQIAAMATLLLGQWAARPALSEALLTVTMLGAVAGTLLSAVAAREEKCRLPWLVLGAGLLSYAAGQAYSFFAQGSIATFPTPADGLRLAAYPCVFAAIALLVREQHEDRRLGISFDAAIVAVAITALTHELVMDRLVPVDHASGAFGRELFAYSVLDLGIAIVLALAALQSRGRIGGSYVAMSLGALVLLATEFFHARVLVHGSYEPGTILDAGWSAGILLFGLSSRFGSSLRRASALRGRPLYLMSVGTFAVAFGLLLFAALSGHAEDPGVIAFAVLLPFLILARLVASVRENDRLARDNKGIISAAGEGILRQDLQGRLVYANPAALEMLGYSLSEVLGRDAHGLFHHTYPNGFPYPASECPSRQSFCRGATQRVTEEVFWRRDGSSIPVDYTVAPIREEGRIVGAVTVFDDVTHQRELKERLRHQADHEERIRGALDEDRLVVYSQPIVDLATGDVVREELLVRMLGEEGETIPPAAFLPAAERFGLIQEVDLLVLAKAIELARLGNPVAVNVSGLSLADRRYLELLEGSVRTGGLDPSLLDFEITETAAVANMSDAQDFARRLRDLGCSLSLDDFGTGFSSFTYLKHIPSQYLKIDTEFIHEIKRNPADRRLVAAIVAIARGLGQKTVAEGVEDGETLAVVRELGVDYAQGFHVGRPTATYGRVTWTRQPARSGSPAPLR